MSVKQFSFKKNETANVTPGVHQMCSNFSLEFEGLALFFDKVMWCAIPGDQSQCVWRKGPVLQIM